ncbi:MAG TPA: amidase family protein, partial [Alphaproteobacteria bacterium]|nr:amidase family protein [Alphaproteobacteria bacterium]
MTHPADLSLTETVDSIASGAFSAVEVAEATLARIEARQAVLNCFVRIDPEGAIATAKAADAKRARGEELGLLHGAPLAHKDMYYRAGVPVT